MPCLSISLLGPFHVTLDGEPVTGFESNKVRALLAYLATETRRPHSREALAGLLWPDQPDSSARRNLSQALFNLRQTLQDEQSSPSFLNITRGTVQFNAESDHWLDARAFTEHLAAVQAHEHPSLAECEACLEQLERAVELYAGEFLAGLFVDDSAAFGEWAVLRRERLHRQVLDALYHLTEHHEQRRDYARAMHHARRQVELEPWREEAHHQLMRLLVRSGQRSAALQQYEVCRRSLADELGIEPSEDTKRLYRRIRLAPEIGAHNLPPQSTHFVGREHELREIARRLTSPACRLLTLVGPGGIGKTRLALQAAHDQRFAFLHGVCFAPLASVESELLVAAIAEALRLSRGQPNARAQLLEALRDKEMLLVLDGFEHLVQDGPPLLAEVLQAAPEVKFLVTSRERLNLYGETVLSLEGLPVPGEQEMENASGFGAVKLFLQSADRAQVGFAAAQCDVRETARICQLVGGMPLGIELAASWVRTLPCREIAAEIEKSLAFLSASLRGVSPRHRSIQAAFDHSWQRLSVEEQRTFARLSVFRGGFDRQAAAEVAGATLAGLTVLVDKSFLKETLSGRYGFHELMRQYGADKLAQDPRAAQATHDRFCRYYAGVVQSQLKRFLAGQQRDALDALEAELVHLRSAWQYALDQNQHENIERMMCGLHEAGLNRNIEECAVLFGKAVAALKPALAGPAQSSEAARRAARYLLGRLLWRYGELFRLHYNADDEMVAVSRQSVELLRAGPSQAELSRALRVLGGLLGDRHSAEARRLCEESVAFGRQANDRRALAQALMRLSRACQQDDEPGRARQLVEESFAICRQDHDMTGVADSLNALGSLAYCTGKYAEARRLYLASQAAYEELGEVLWANVARSNAGHACYEMGDYASAARYLRDALQQGLALRARRFPLNILHGIAELLLKQGRLLEAYTLAAFVAHEPTAYPTATEPAQLMLNELGKKLPPDVAAAAQARATAWTLDDAVAETLAIEKICPTLPSPPPPV